MRSFLSPLSSLMLLLLVPVVTHAQTQTKVTYKPDSQTGSVIKELASQWWIWLGIIVLLGLIGFLFYLRNKSDD